MKSYILPIIAAAALVAFATGCNRSIEAASQDFNSLPQAVQKAIRAEARDAEIAQISKTTENGIEAYRVEFRQDGTNPKMLVAADGRVLSSDFAHKTEGVLKTVEKALTPTGAVGTKFSALPESVQKTIQSRAGESQIADITRHEDNGRVIYEVSFRDNQAKNPSIRVAADGSLIQDVQK